MIIIFVFILFSFSYNQAALYLLYSNSTKASGMGIRTADYENVDLFWNPASLSFKNYRVISFSNGNKADGMTPSLNLFYPSRRFSFGFRVWGYEVSDIEIFDYWGNHIGSVIYGGEVVSVAGSFKIFKNFASGFTLNRIKDYLRGSGMELNEEYIANFLNISFLWKLKKLEFSLCLFNIGEAEFQDIGEAIISGGIFGLTYRTGKWSFSFERGGYGDENSSIVGVGLQYKIHPSFILRGGVKKLNDEGSPCFGFTYIYKSVEVDFSFQSYDVFDNSALLGIGYRWGIEKKRRIERKPIMKRPIERKIEIKELKKGEKINIAVLDFEARPPISPAEARFISDFFRADLVRSPLLSLVDRNNMEKIFAEQGLQQTGCTTTECAVQLGKVLNVRYIVTGSCGKLLNKYVITMNVINVETAQIIYSDDVSIDNPDLLRDTIREMVERFLESIK